MIKNMTILFALAVVLTTSTPIFAGTYSGGSGTAEDPYQIATVADWLELIDTSADCDKNFILIDDINLEGISVTPVADNKGAVFTGVFDGKGHFIRNATINLPSTNYVGLFGYVLGSGQIKNLGVVNVNISGTDYVGGLTGVNSGRLISCYSTGNVNGIGTYAGGLAGLNYGNITSCYSACFTNGSSAVGGIVGGNNEGIVNSCYANGPVTGKSGVGGLVGSYAGSISTSFWDIETSGCSTSAGGTGKTTAQMKMLSTYSEAGWDFVAVWQMCDGVDYPHFMFEELCYGGIPSIYLTAPYGGQIVLEGDSLSIIWETTEPISHILIEYSANGGQDWFEIARTDNIGSYAWTPTGINSDNCLVRVSDASSPDKSDTSNRPFTISKSFCLEILVGDLNGDCIVDLSDMALMAENWLRGGNFRIYKNVLDSDPIWSVEGQWAFGQPTGGGGTEKGKPDPTSGKTGSNVFGVNLSGDYTVALGGPYSLTTGPFNCRSYHDLKLKFARWLNTDGPNYVLCTVDVSSNGSAWTMVWQNDSVVTDNNWVPVEYDVSAVADNQETVYFRWTYKILHERAYPYSGWNIDDIEIIGKR